MTNADDYLAWIKSVILLCPVVINLTIVREETQSEQGLWRYRLVLKNNSLLEMFEFFSIESEQVNVVKYSYHWQTDDGKLVKRWDNAAHHPEITTYPHHLHDRSEDFVLDYNPLDIQQIIKIVTELILFAEN
ncbi:MAG: DUF6516 family protein [Snowella sp.]|nr:DUF6516 family protein [Snowella sp.]